MDGIYTIVCSDNREGDKIASELQDLGTQVIRSALPDLDELDVSDAYVVLLIIDLNDVEPEKILKQINRQKIANSWLKFVFMPRAKIIQMADINHNILHLEFLQRPLRMAEFILLVEKSILAERFKIMLREASLHLKEKGESFERLFDIYRKKLFETDSSSSEVFAKILKMQRKLDDETYRFQKAIDRFSVVKQKNLFLDEPINNSELIEALLPGKNNNLEMEVLQTLEQLKIDNERLETALLEAEKKLLGMEGKL